MSLMLTRRPRQDPWRNPWRLTRQCTEEQISRIQSELAVVAARSDPLPEVWKIVEKELLEELAELKLSFSIFSIASHTDPSANVLLARAPPSQRQSPQ